MPVSIKIGKPPVPPEEEPVVTVNLNIRKTMDGDIMIFDHVIIIDNDDKFIIII